MSTFWSENCKCSRQDEKQPPYNPNLYFIPFTVFMVLKTTGLSSRFKCKNCFLKICPGSRDIKQNRPKIRLPNQTWIFLDILVNISGPVAYFFIQIFALKPWAQASRFEYHKSYIQNKKIWIIREGFKN